MGRDAVAPATGMDHPEDMGVLLPDPATGTDHPADIGGRAQGFLGLSLLSRELRFCRRIQDIRRIRQPLHIVIRGVTTAWFLFAATTDGATAGVMTG